MISAIVLAAGEASRFGQLKQLARLGEKTLLEHAIENVHDSRVDHLVIVLGAHADEIRVRIPLLSRENVVINPDYARGMSTSIQAGLRALPDDVEATFIVLADQPFVTPGTIDLLIDRFRRPPEDGGQDARGPRGHPGTAPDIPTGLPGTTPDIPTGLPGTTPDIPTGLPGTAGVPPAVSPKVVIPTWRGFRGNPVLVSRALFAEMMEIRGDVGCRAIFGAHSSEIDRVAVDDRGVVMDIDTVEDFERMSHEREPHLPQTRSAVDPDDVPEMIAELRRRHQPFAVATVVRAERPTSSKPGDKAIIAPDGTLTGWIGGSCAHDIVVANALESLEAGAPRLLTLGGESCDADTRPGIIGVPMQCYSGGVLDVFIEPDLPRPQIVVVGYEAVAGALTRISKTLRFRVTVVDPLASAESAPEADEIVNELNLAALPLRGEAFIVIATHGRFDEEALRQAVETSASYIALVASPKRGAVILDQLRDVGMTEEAIGRIKVPAGLDIGAEGAEEIALSILAEIVRLRRAGELNREPIVSAAPEPAEETDPICGMKVAVAGAMHTAEHEGRRYYFCCAHCKQTFEKDPHRYADVA